MDHIIKALVWFRRRVFFRIVQRTLVMLMPVATIGAVFQLLRDEFFSPDSLIYNIFNFEQNMPDIVWNAGSVITRGMVQVTIGIFGIYVAYFAAVYTARLYHKDSTMAGIAAVIVITFCSYLGEANRSVAGRTTFYSRVLNINGTLFAIIVGYIVGQVFHYLGKSYVKTNVEHVIRIRHRAWNALLPTVVAILLGLLIGIVIYLFKIRLLDSYYFTSIASRLQSSNNLLVIIPMTMLVSLLWWLGIGYPISSLTNASNSGAAIANMNYALRHGNSYNVPYKYLGSSLINSYAIMVIFALVMVIILYAKQKEIESVAKINLIPVTFGASNGLLVGLPIILNPVYFVPIVFLPAVNELFAAAAIKLHIIMPTVYPVLSGSPGILYSFFGTNGHWPNLIFTIVLFILDIIILIPAIKIGQEITDKVSAYDKEEDKYAK